jgi:hypothetical protein
MRQLQILILALAACTPAYGQYQFQQPGYVQPPTMQPGPRERRALREKAVAQVGPSARPLVEAYGDPACKALFTCSLPVAKKLCEFHAAAELQKLPEPGKLLQAIAQPGNGDDVVNWAILHAPELANKDHFDAFLESPLEFALGLKDLAGAAADLRARRLSAPPPAQPLTPTGMQLQQPAWDWRGVAAVAAVVGVLALLWWRKRQQSPG